MALGISLQSSYKYVQSFVHSLTFVPRRGRHVQPKSTTVPHKSSPFGDRFVSLTFFPEGDVLRVRASLRGTVALTFGATCTTEGVARTCTRRGRHAHRQSTTICSVSCSYKGTDMCVNACTNNTYVNRF